VNNKYCGVSCQNKHQGTDNANKRYGVLKDFNVNCKTCKTNFIVEEREKLFPKKKKYYCSRSCANKRVHSKETKNKIKKTLVESVGTLPMSKICRQCKEGFKTKRKNQLYCCRSCAMKWRNLNKLIKKEKSVRLKNHTLICKQCEKVFKAYQNKQKYCCRSCAVTWRNTNEGLSVKAGLASAKSQSETRRSKNEIYFSELCSDYFDVVLTNEPMFNGWDADVIIEDIKVAVMWNGAWHYKKITEQHSVKQVQNRDKIKIEEITKMGYLPYIIKDMGKSDKKFVKKEFDLFIDYMKQMLYICV
jgi:hypothetical protein